MDGFQSFLAGRIGYPAERGAIARLARASGVKAHVISRWLDDQADDPIRPSPKNLQKIAPPLEVDYDDLLKLVYNSSDAPAPRHPVTPHDRLLRVADVLAEAVAEIRRAAIAMQNESQPNLSPRTDQSSTESSSDKRYQTVPPRRVLIALPVYPRAGDRHLPAAA